MVLFLWYTCYESILWVLSIVIKTNHFFQKINVQKYKLPDASHTYIFIIFRSRRELAVVVIVMWFRLIHVFVHSHGFEIYVWQLTFVNAIENLSSWFWVLSEKSQRGCYFTNNGFNLAITALYNFFRFQVVRVFLPLIHIQGSFSRPIFAKSTIDFNLHDWALGGATSATWLTHTHSDPLSLKNHCTTTDHSIETGFSAVFVLTVLLVQEAKISWGWGWISY